MDNPKLIKKASKRQQPLIQPISMFGYVDIDYYFPVAPEDRPMLNDPLAMMALGAKYIKEKFAECSFKLSSPFWSEHILTLVTEVNSSTSRWWNATEKSVVDMDLTDSETLPPGFPKELAAGLSKYGNIQGFLTAKLPNYGKKIPEWLRVRLELQCNFDFMIGEKEKFNVKKITVLPDWNGNGLLSFFYNGRYIPVTSIGRSTHGDLSGVNYTDIATNIQNFEYSIRSEHFSIAPRAYIFQKIPFVKEILFIYSYDGNEVMETDTLNESYPQCSKYNLTMAQNSLAKWEPTLIKTWSDKMGFFVRVGCAVLYITINQSAPLEEWHNIAKHLERLEMLLA